MVGHEVWLSAGMARIESAELRAEGDGPHAVFTVEATIDWDRGDDDHGWHLVVRFMGADAGLRGGDEVLKIHTVEVAPGGGERVTVSVDNNGGEFNEDAGGDEIVAECELQVLQPEARVLRTNKVKGRF